MEFEPTEIPGVAVLRPPRHGDARGFFSETFRREWFADAGLRFVQDNHSLSATAGTVRGLHFQVSPAEQGKLVRVSRGAVLDVAVDIRAGSPTFGDHVAQVLSAENWIQLWVPPGFAHGFCTLEPDTEVLYKVTGSYYAPEHEHGLRWDDPALGVEWPPFAGSVVSERDRRWPGLDEISPSFRYPV